MSAFAAEYRQLEARILEGMRSGWSSVEFDPLWLEVFAFQQKYNAPYANYCATQPPPKHWREIPAAPQSAFKRFALTVAPAGQIAKTFRTSGTTGEGAGEHHFHTTQLYEESVRRGWERLGLGKRAHLVLTPRAEEAPHSSLAHMVETLAPLSSGSRWFIEAGQLSSAFFPALEAAEKVGAPVTLLGTALAFLNVFEQLGSRHFQLPAGSVAMETGGYKGSGREIPKAELYAMFGDFLGIAPDNVINEYGMTELSSQFYTRGVGQPHLAPPWLRALVSSPETGAEVAVGEGGVLRHFDLANLGSVCAIETQDLALRHAHGFELLGRDPAALPRGCSRPTDELMRRR